MKAENRKTSRTIDFLKCFFGIHCVPKNWAFETMCAVFAGGICPRCGKVKRGKFLGNTWTRTAPMDNGGTRLEGFDVSFLKSSGHNFNGSLCDLRKLFEFCRSRKVDFAEVLKKGFDSAAIDE